MWPKDSLPEKKMGSFLISFSLSYTVVNLVAHYDRPEIYLTELPVGGKTMTT